MADRIDYPLTVYYDGACSLCRRQMARYRERDQRARLLFQDITDHQFHAGRYGLDIGELQRAIHVVDRAGRVARGADAVVWIWWATGSRLLPILMRIPGINILAKRLYKLVARGRYLVSSWRGEKLCRGKCGWRRY